MIPVLVVGGGPVGLSLAGRLGQLGVPAVLVEQHPDTAAFPKGRALSIRSMEIFRSWGLEKEITAAGLPREHLAFYSGRTLTDPCGTRIVTGPASRPPVPSPTYTLLCSQDRLEPLLLAHAQRLQPGRIRFGTELVDLTVDRDGVTVELSAGGHHERLRARYLVAADGARSGIRGRLGIAMAGPSGVSRNLNILFDADLGQQIADRPCAVYTITQPGLHGAFLAVDNQHRWLFNLVADGDEVDLDRLDDADCVGLVRTAAGLPDLTVTVVGRQVWHAAAQVAERFRHGPVFLAGDAAHVTTPYGGFGMNCGIADADNLAWKLAAVHHGWAAPELLDTYEPERRPVALASAAESHRRLVDTIDAQRTGAPPRGRPSEGLVLGYHYASAAVITDGAPPPPGDPVADYVPTGRPGHRLPHIWLDEEQTRSTLDLVTGDGLTLLAGPAAAWVPIAVEQARLAEFPLTVHALDDALPQSTLAAFLDRCGLRDDGGLLLRPDGHIGWRTPGTPRNGIREMMDRVRQPAQMPGRRHRWPAEGDT
ncbi:FAD-dependent monooxygenase [Micromonospora sp. WMMD961]|uniref:FAD-dependent monooxygenase n=1 Tax=Micromonospora sp. WMMD961 TaxID=3016100 RepID=UPI002416FA38|nr:FAD-dependent monooxygenase [Micromonospora sp. WMMD961]MDG4782374.1 FAD-dependent monooxygenase [Micromonospora sp. WMMD961]